MPIQLNEAIADKAEEYDTLKNAYIDDILMTNLFNLDTPPPSAERILAARAEANRRADVCDRLYLPGIFLACFGIIMSFAYSWGGGGVNREGISIVRGDCISVRRYESLLLA